MGGALVRAIDLYVDHDKGAFDQPRPDFNPKAFAEEMKVATSTYCGVAGREFVRLLIDRNVTGDDLRERVNEFVSDALSAH